MHLQNYAELKRYADSVNLKALPSTPLEDRTVLPRQAGIYFIVKDDIVLYVGKSRNIRRRWMSTRHHKLSEIKTLNHIKIAWLTYEALSNLSELERAFIVRFKPKFNGVSSPKRVEPALIDVEKVKAECVLAVMQELAKEAKALGLNNLLALCEKEFTPTEIILTTKNRFHAERLSFCVVELAKWLIEQGRKEVLIRWPGDEGNPYRVPRWYAFLDSK